MLAGELEMLFMNTINFLEEAKQACICVQYLSIKNCISHKQGNWHSCSENSCSEINVLVFQEDVLFFFFFFF